MGEHNVDGRIGDGNFSGDGGIGIAGGDFSSFGHFQSNLQSSVYVSNFSRNACKRFNGGGVDMANEFALWVCIRSIGLCLMPFVISSNSSRLALLKLYILFWDRIKTISLKLKLKIHIQTKRTLHKLGDTALLLLLLLGLELFFFFALVLRLQQRDVDDVGRLQFPRNNVPLRSQWSFFNNWTRSEKSYSGKSRTSSYSIKDFISIYFICDLFLCVCTMQTFDKIII